VHFSDPLTPESRQFTAFSTRTKRLEFLRVPLGLRISSGAFISALCSVFANEIADHSLSLYVDDAIFCHSSFLGHLEQLRHIFQKLRTHNLRINPKKSTFARESVAFLGFVFSASGIKLIHNAFRKLEISGLRKTSQRPAKSVVSSMYFRDIFQILPRF
jgi:hypothetical protein